ncbi:MAG: phosphoadenylyl-sulfate reductase [Beijerinckiaceae bacterium]|jgi:phosphoadenosine phosphosulfate reductase|nr:phosphoadenylyl-sulfate reductase [Beijerinckiaceae bacterium]
MSANVSITAQLAWEFSSLDVPRRVQSLRRQVAGRLVFTSSLGLEDQVITHFIAETGVNIEIVTLDTGRMFPETHDLWAATQNHYKLPIKGCFPETEALAHLVGTTGVNGFYASADNRHACCHVRKIEPLKRALAGAQGWITGLRADASGNRADMAPVEYDGQRDLIKFNPLFDWSRKQVAEFAASHDVPVSPLHARGFMSIGCAPCTRAVRPGEPERAGRWWWEQDDKRECGLHVDANGRLVRSGRDELQGAVDGA